jgi:hypothetical protein
MPILLKSGTLVSRKLGKAYEQPRKAEAIYGNCAPEDCSERLLAYFVPEDALCRQRTRPASSQCEKVESGFRCAPFPVPCSQLVSAINYERYCTKHGICAEQGHTSRPERDEICYSSHSATVIFLLQSDNLFCRKTVVYGSS